MVALFISLLLLVFLMIIGVPVPFAFGAMAIILATVLDVNFSVLLPAGFYQIKSVVLLTIPFFILIGSLMSSGGLAEKLIDFVNVFVGRIRGGLGAVTVIACAMFGSIGGSCSAAVAAIGTIMIPKMEEGGYTRGHATALVACASILGQLIPPSVPMILFALVTYQSIPGCWLATIGPGMLVMLMYCVLNFIMVKKMPLNLAPKVSFADTIKEFKRATLKAGFTLILPIIILGGIYGGIATPTESACIGLIYVVVVSLAIYKYLNYRQFGSALVSGITTAGVLIILLFFVMVNTRILTMEQIPQEIADWILNISPNKFVLLIMVNIFLLIIGMIMDDISGTVLAATLLAPVMTKMGIHPLHFAAIVGVNLGLGNVTPPTAPILYLAGRIGDCTIDKYIFPAMILMTCGMIPVALLTTYWPGLSLFLPKLLGFAN